MEKTIEEIRKAVLAYCDEVCPQGARHDVVANDVTIGWMGHGDTMDGGLRMYFFADWMYIDADMDDRTALLAYRLLGLDKRDALEAERGKSVKLVEAFEEIKKPWYIFNLGKRASLKNTLEQYKTRCMAIQDIVSRALEAYKEGKKDE